LIHKTASDDDDALALADCDGAGFNDGLASEIAGHHVQVPFGALCSPAYADDAIRSVVKTASATIAVEYGLIISF
jgi:hypothetical protein